MAEQVYTQIQETTTLGGSEIQTERPRENEDSIADDYIKVQLTMTPEMEAYFDKDNLYPLMKDIDIGDEMEEFYLIKRHYLIFTEAGKPVYTRYGDEQVIAPYFASMSTVIPKI